MIKITLPNELPENIQHWKTTSDRYTAEILAETDVVKQHALIERYKQHWRDPDLVQWLSEISSNKCWYTETFFGGDYQEVEHFRPKKSVKDENGEVVLSCGYFWLAFDIDNYRLCKSRPNRKKSTFFPIVNERRRARTIDEPWRDEVPLFLDPLKASDVLLISFNDDGAPVSQEDINQQDDKRVKFTIDKYHLDERTLNIRRKDTWLTARSLYGKYMKELEEVNRSNSVSAREKAESEVNQLIAMLQPSAEFSAVAKESLLKLGERQAIQIACSQ